MVDTVFQVWIVNHVDQRIRRIVGGHERGEVRFLHRHAVLHHLEVLTPAIPGERWFKHQVRAVGDGVKIFLNVVHALVDAMQREVERQPAFVVA